MRLGSGKLIAFTLICSVVASCSRPTARFRIEQSSKKAPTNILLVDESQNTEKITWTLNDQFISEDSIVSRRLLLSGHYSVKLKAEKGNKVTSMEKEFIVDPPDQCLVEMNTPYGSMLIQLYDETFKHRDNFLKLVEEKYYDGLIFHRVIENFMIQGGDPNSRNSTTGTRLGGGGPGYQIEAEFVESLVHVKGALAAARTGDAVNPEKKSSGSQFYIVQGQSLTERELNSIENRTGIVYSKEIREEYKKFGGAPFLDRQYTVFGRVIEGLEVIDKIAEAATDQADRPAEDIKMAIKLIK